MDNEEGRFKPDQFPEPPLTKSCAGTTKGATLHQFKMTCVSTAAFSLFFFPPAMHSLPLPCASTSIYLLDPKVGQFRELY